MVRPTFSDFALKFCAHICSTCVFATPPKYPEINLLPPRLTEHCSHAAPSSCQSRARSARGGAGECHGYLFDLNLNFKTSLSLHFPLFKSIIHEIHKRARVLGCRASTWTALNLIHCFSFITSKYMSPCLVHKCLLRTLGETWGVGGLSVSREGCCRQRDTVRGMVAEGDAGGRWRRMRSGALGTGRRTAEREEDERKRNAATRRKTGRRRGRGQTELKQPRQPAASVINNMYPMCDRQSGVAADHRPWMLFITASRGNTQRRLEQDIVLKRSTKIAYFPFSSHHSVFLSHPSLCVCAGKMNKEGCNEKSYNLVRSSHCVVILQVVNRKKGRPCLAAVETQFGQRQTGSWVK